MINFLIGRSNTGKSKYIFDYMLSNINSDKNIYYIVPEQMTLEAEKKLTSLTDQPIFNIKIMSFDRLAQDVLSNSGGISKKYIDDIGILMILKYISILHQDEFITYADSLNKNGFLEDVSSIISDFQKNAVSPEILDAKLASVDDNNKTKVKVSEINNFYKHYLSYTKNTYIDSDSRLNLLKEKLRNTDYLQDTHIFFDKFFSFNMLEFGVIEELFVKNNSIAISLDLDCKNYNAFNECFDITYNTFQTLTNLADKSNTKYKVTNFEKNIQENRALSHLEYYFSSFKTNHFTEKAANIHFHKSENIEKEIINLAKNITDLIRKKGYKYGEIRVFCPDILEYKDEILSIFTKFDIPYFLDNKKSPAMLNISVLIFAFLDLFSTNLDTKSVISFFKTSLTQIPQYNYQLLENFLQRWDIHILSRQITRENLNEYLFEEYSEDEKIIILESIEYIKNIYFSYKDTFSKEENSVKEYIYSLTDFLKKTKVQEHIKENINSLTNSGYYEYASILSLSWNEIMDVISQIESILSGCVIDISNFIKILYQGINAKKISVIPPTADQVVISDTSLTRLYSSKSVFFIGLCDTLLPKISANSSILLEDDLENLKNLDIDLTNTFEHTLSDELINIYHLISCATDEIFFSYPINDHNGEDARMSTYLSQILKLFPSANISSDVGISSYILPNKKYTFENLYKQMSENIYYKNLTNEQIALSKYFINDKSYKDKSKYYIDALFYKNKNVQINKEFVPNLYNLPLKTSISQIEDYNLCPFKHFMDYGIKPVEKATAQMDYIDIGNILHKGIESFAKKIKTKDISMDFTDELVEKEIDEIFSSDDFLNNKVKLLKNNFKQVSYRFKKIKKISYNAGKLLLSQIKNSKFTIKKVEENIPFVSLKIDNTGDDNYDQINIRGKVDRIDEYKDEKGLYINIIDYKSSNKDINLNDIYNGINIQMPVYLYLLSQNYNANPACVLYFPMVDKFIETNIYGSEEISQIALKENFRMNGLFLNDEKILDALDTIDNIKSKYLNIKMQKGSTKNVNLLEENQLKLLLDFTINSIKKTCKEIIKGSITPNPVSLKKTPHCTFCRYKNICKFDPSLDGYKYKIITDHSTQKIIELMMEEKNEMD